MYTAKFLKEKKNISYFHKKKEKKSKICFSMHFDFNNQFIKVMRTWLVFQKNLKKYFIFF
jgi:hypothetical protein